MVSRFLMPRKRREERGERGTRGGSWDEGAEAEVGKGEVSSAGRELKGDELELFCPTPLG